MRIGNLGRDEGGRSPQTRFERSRSPPSPAPGSFPGWEGSGMDGGAGAAPAPPAPTVNKCLEIPIPLLGSLFENPNPCGVLGAPAARRDGEVVP